jgi:predicted permease
MDSSVLLNKLLSQINTNGTENNTNTLMGQNALNAMLPIADVLNNLIKVFESLFGSQFLMYILLMLIAGFLVTFMGCYFVYYCVHVRKFFPSNKKKRKNKKHKNDKSKNSFTVSKW